MKLHLTFLLLIGCLALTDGCMSMRVMSKAKPSPKEVWLPQQEKFQTVPVKGQPGYYALLPFAIGGDIATSPFQLVFSIMATSGKGGPL
jgi:hypothetical protein